MRNAGKKVAVIGVLLLPLLSSRGAAFQDSPYFPETGPGAIHQRKLELSNPGVVLFVALQPGYEDLAMIAQLRMGVGARGIVVFATNGDATPGDAGGTAPVHVAAQRKEEAYQVSRYLGASAYFLNVPDPGVVPGKAVLERIWNGDTVVARLERALRHFRPDVVVVGGDRRGEATRSDRQELLADLVLRALRVAGDPKARPDTVLPAPWRVPRVFVESAHRIRETIRLYDAVHPVWKKSYGTIGSEARLLYRSMQYQSEQWTVGGDRSYALAGGHGDVNVASLMKGLPVLGAISQSLRPSIDRVVRGQSAGKQSAVSKEVLQAIDSVDIALARHRAKIPVDDLRIVASWKNTLETLRCALLGVTVEYSADSLVTKSQLAYLRFGDVSPKVDSARTRIFFPGAVDHTWGINVTLESQFPFWPHSEFRVITPRSPDFSIPMSQYGISQASLFTRFSFIIIHRDSIRSRDFIYRGEVPFRFGPRRTQEVLTPVVRAIDGEPVVVRLINISRDPYKGTVSFADSLTVPKTREVILPSKNFVFIDTVRLSLRAPLPAGDYPLKLVLQGGGDLPFVARSFDVKSDSGAKVGLLSTLADGPVEQALGRIRVPWEKIDVANAEPGYLTHFNVVLVDRVALAGVRSPAIVWGGILDWVRGGGSLVILPPAPVVAAAAIPGAKFFRSMMLAPTDSLRVDSNDPLVTGPNALSAADWEQWVVARSLYSIHVDQSKAGHVVVASADGKAPLVITLSEGKGKITVVGLDLYSQLTNIHPGAHRILANLLKP